MSRSSLLTLMGSGGVPVFFDKPTKSVRIVATSLQSVYLPHAVMPAYNRQKFSVSIWFRLTGGLSANQCIIGKGDELTLAGSEFNILTTGSGNFQFACFTAAGAGATANLITNNAPLQNDVWHHLLAWFDSNNATANDRMKLFLDGVELTSFGTRNNPALGMELSTSSKPLTLGKLDPTRTLQMDGYIYQPALYNDNIELDRVYGGTTPLKLRIANCKATNDPSSDIRYNPVTALNEWVAQNSAASSATIPS